MRVACWVALLLLILIPRWISIFTEAINWDEFAMLERVERTLRLGDVVGGGRPGLVTLILIPFVRDCVDAITTAVRGRMLWQVFTLSYLCGVYFLVRNWFRFSRRPESGVLEGAAAVALLGLLPAFVAWSVQIRSDQAALAAAVWGGVCMLSERRSRAILAGLMFGLALLCTQKGLYPIALCGLLWGSAVLSRREDLSVGCRGSELVARCAQVIIVCLATAATIAAYMYLVPSSANLIDSGFVTSAWDDMRRAHARVGFTVYRTEASQALLHILLFTALIIASCRTIFDRSLQVGHLLVTCWAILLLGLAITLVHGSSYQYFLMTAGLFPAVSLGMASGHLAGSLGKSRRAVIGLALASLILGTVPVTLEMWRGSQANQRDTTQWIRTSGLNTYGGFQVDGALICQEDPDPIPPMSHRLNMRQLSEAETDAFIDEFRRRPVAFVIDADRLGYFPEKVKQFWTDHYRWYYGSVFVAGFDIRPEATVDSVDVIVPGQYRWIPSPPHKDAALHVNGNTILAGGGAMLEAGVHRFTSQPAGAGGSLVLAVGTSPGQRIYPFIDHRQRERLGGVR